MTDVQNYLADEWLSYAQDPRRQQDARRAVGGVTIARVLDIGCGGGQDLVPFATDGATGVGLDIDPQTVRWARQRIAGALPGLPIVFAAGAAEGLPFRDGSFDAILCRVTIPYTDNRAALAEMSRVLRAGGVLLLRTHRPRYYVRKFLDGIRMRSPKFSIHALRVLVSGTIYWLTGSQPRGGLLLRESYLTTGMLQRELSRFGLRIDAELDDSIPLAGSYRLVKVPESQRPKGPESTKSPSPESEVS